MMLLEHMPIEEPVSKPDTVEVQVQCKVCQRWATHSIFIKGFRKAGIYQHVCGGGPGDGADIFSDGLFDSLRSAMGFRF